MRLLARPRSSGPSEWTATRGPVCLLAHPGGVFGAVRTHGCPMHGHEFLHSEGDPGRREDVVIDVGSQTAATAPPGQKPQPFLNATGRTVAFPAVSDTAAVLAVSR